MSEDLKCKHCGCDEFVAELTPEMTHYARRICTNCQTQNDWFSHPDKDDKNRPSKHKNLVKKYSKGFCEMCLITSDDLEDNRTLEGHHVKPYKNGGSSDRENVWIVCTSCHSLIHWKRTYHGTNERIPN